MAIKKTIPDFEFGGKITGNMEITGDLNLSSTTSDGFFGGNVLVAGGNSNLSTSNFQTNFEVSGDTVLGFPLTWFGYSNKGFHNPFTAEIAGLGLPDRFSDIILTSGFLGYYHQSFTSQDKAPLNFEGYIGSTTPTDPVFSWVGHKWNGTTGKANLASTEKLANFKNGFASLNIWGDAGIDVGSGKLSFVPGGTYPTDSNSWVGTTNNGHNLTLNQENGFTLTFQHNGSSIGTWTSSTLTALTNFVITQPVATSSTSTALTVTGGAHTTLTAGAESISANFNFGQTIQHATGALNTQRAVSWSMPTYSFVGASTLTKVVGFAIDKAPSAGTNATVTATYLAQFGGNTSIGPSAATQHYSVFDIPDHFVTITGSTNNTFTIPAFAGITIGNITVTNASAVTVDNAAALYLSGPVQAGGSVTLTNPYTIWVDAGAARFDGRVLFSSGAHVTAANDLTLGVDGNVTVVDGNTTINGIATVGWTSGSPITLIFSGTPTVKNNTAASAGFARIFLAGSADLSAAANTVLNLVYDGTQWQETSRKVA